MDAQTLGSQPDCHYSSYSGPSRLLHWGPLIAIAIILWISIFTVYCDLMYWPVDTIGGAVNLIIFVTWVILVFYHHYLASALGPGFIPLKWTPKPAHQEYLQYCKVCQGYKAPRSHHCRKCNRCVMKMDHHCPWINTCCGHFNHANFTYFLFFAPIGCIHAFYILARSLYYGLNLRWYLQHGTGMEPRIYFTFYTLVGSMFAIGLAFGIIISVGVLFVVQAKSVWYNKTGIEEWIDRKSTYRDREEDFIYPYDLGRWRNIRQVLFTSSGWPKSDGFSWEVKDGCGQFDLTVEQKLQKVEKQERATEYVGVRRYAGTFFPITQGLCVCCCFPWSDESRIPIDVGDKLVVTRWRNHWLYGDKILTPSEGKVRGWFPRRCVEEAMSEDGAGDTGLITKKKK
ncbi:palmitoyltransferase ZDHHC6-like isoform X2 [Watersipora subatra]|uniref:palmitoyltransferase ZDHHC6-like isoform X2 n=1 Tax=Watersipora subatra TaxID=2589382 RepID=UPI00355B975D